MIKNISIDLLVPFENHPFKKRNGIEQQELTESIKENGLLEPIIVRSFPAGKYEIISGHRRVEACNRIKDSISLHNRHCGIASVQYLYIVMPCCPQKGANSLWQQTKIYKGKKKESPLCIAAYLKTTI